MKRDNPCFAELAVWRSKQMALKQSMQKGVGFVSVGSFSLEQSRLRREIVPLEEVTETDTH